MEELEAIKEAEEAALAEAEAAAAEAAEAMGEVWGALSGVGGGGNNDSPPDSPGTTTNGTGGRIIDVVAAAGTASSLHSPSRESMTSTMGKYAVKDAESSKRSDIFRSYDTGVDNHHNHHLHHHHQSSTDIDNTDRMSVRSATLSVYRSEDSLAATRSQAGAQAAASGAMMAAPSASTSGKLGSLPASPFVRRASKSNSFGSHVRLHEKYGGAAANSGSSKKPLVLFTYLDAQEHLPYADDSNAVTPKSEVNGYIVVDTPTRMNLARRVSYTSHSGKVDSYNSHTDLRYPPNANYGSCSSNKENTLRRRMASLFSDMAGDHRGGANSIHLEPILSSSSNNPQGGSMSKGTNGKSNLAPLQRATMENGSDSLDMQVRESKNKKAIRLKYKSL